MRVESHYKSLKRILLPSFQSLCAANTLHPTNTNLNPTITPSDTFCYRSRFSVSLTFFKMVSSALVCVVCVLVMMYQYAWVPQLDWSQGGPVVAWYGLEGAMGFCLVAEKDACAVVLATAVDVSRKAFLQADRVSLYDVLVTPHPVEVLTCVTLLFVQRGWAEVILASTPEGMQRVRTMIRSWRSSCRVFHYY